MADSDKGMKELAGTMDAGCFACLLSLLNWAKLWQELHEGGAEMTKDSVQAMLIPFMGLGNDPHTWMRHGPQVVGALTNEIAKWTGDPVYRAANTMPWCILSVGAPALAMANKGMAFSMEAHKIIAEHFTVGESPDVPSLAAVIERTARQPAVSDASAQPAGSKAGTGGIARRPQNSKPLTGNASRPDPYA